MEIDLELPSGEQDKLDTGSDTNVDIVNGTDGLHAEEEDVNSPSTSEHCKENTGPNVNENVIGGGDCVNVNAFGADVNKGAINFEPQNGLEFESKEAAYSFYREYARSVGFGITIKASRRSKRSGKFIDVKIACSRFGSKRESGTAINPRSCPKTDCKASMHMKRRQDGKWIIYSFIKEHNHEICPDDFYYSIRGRNKQSVVVACQKKGLQLALDEGDVQLMFEHFMHMQDENPNFFYAIDLDHEKRLKSVFWIDAKDRHDYSNFCDVVFFDTSYVRNNYRIPLTPIVGVNHHLQFMLLGCALIGDETASALVWLLQTWLRAVGGQAPRMIITDQDKSFKEAIAEVFPDAHHCFCLWHILRKIPENVECIMNRYENFMAKFNKCIYRSWTDEQFEKRWWKMIDKFELRENEWILSLYEDRKKWVPNYMRDMFLAGISSTERAGSIASFFDKYVHRETTLKEFLEQYKAFLQDRYEMEAKADFETRERQPALKSLSPIEKQMSALYTPAVFKKFQVEVLGTVACRLQKEIEEEATVVFRVDDFEEHQNFIVAWNETESDIRCLCRSFEYRGFLCRHALLVLQMSGVSNIPSHYILKRWTKDAKIRKTMGDISKGLHYRLQRFNDLCKRAIKLGEEGSLSQETYDIAFQALEEALKHCVGVNNSVRSVLEPNTLPIHGFLDIEEVNHGNSAGKASKKKKTYKKRKVRSEPEAITIRMQESCQQMEQLNSRAHNLDNCYVPQQDMQGMELGARPPTLDSYYGAQQSMQGVVVHMLTVGTFELNVTNP
ncbi:hypothetical protein L1049_024907 [Liquidambar formosana]|uniref:Protein FAR1-RELATED SEQUENCE n=1 Tax=Liquidambar formosana TaxID=63359 RepID=A0AAP0RV77_LIQFO